MSHCPQPQPSDLPDDPGSTEVFSDGRNKVTSVQMSQAAFLANEDERMKALVKLYMEKCKGDDLPGADVIPPEKLFGTGMMSRTHCLRLGEDVSDVRYTVWAADANFDGHRSLQNAAVEDLTNFKPYGLMFEVVKHQLQVTVDSRAPTYFEIKGVVNDHYYYFTKAILPLRNEQGQIIKCLVPFTNKLADIPVDLREKFFSTNIDQ